MTVLTTARKSRSILSGIATAAVAMSIGLAHADISAEPISGLQVDDAVVTLAKQGETALIGFRIENFSSRSFTLVGVRSAIAGSAVIVIDQGGGATGIATAVLIAQNETLDLRSSHLWIELRDVTEAIEPGDLVPFELIFATGTARAEAHAHSWTLKGGR